MSTDRTIDHGNIHISLFKPIKFKLRNNAVLDSSSFLDEMLNNDNIIRVRVDKKLYFGWNPFNWGQVEHNHLEITGLKTGSQTIKWSYEMSCSLPWFDSTHQITFVVEHDTDSGEKICVYKPAVPESGIFVDNRFKKYMYEVDPTLQFRFFDFVSRIQDNVAFQNGLEGGRRELYCYLARTSNTGRLNWGHLYDFFPPDWEPSYYHAIERVVQLTRQWMDEDQITRVELNILISLASDIREYFDFNLFNSNEIMELKLKPLKLWESVVKRLESIARTTEKSLDDFVLAPAAGKKSTGTGGRLALF